MADSTCGHCKFWHAGECFRFPPQMVLYPQDNQHPVFYFPTPCRPQVGADCASCGEFREKVR